ncbi:MAG: exo-alpha-sialidase [Sedimentisphaerales bacterium]|nr:exo-alpha-sialidase [Sedimentisphaerales bacterium]
MFNSPAGIFIFTLVCLFIIGLDVGLVQADTEKLDYKIKLDTVIKGSGEDSWWFHPRVASVPGVGDNGGSRVVMSMQKQLKLSDFYSGLYVLYTNDMGANWTKPDERAELAWRRLEDNITLAVADPTPGWHDPTGKLLVFGCTVHYLNGRQISPQPGVTSYTIHDPKAGTWTPWQEIEMPARDDFFCSRSACSQWLSEPDGTLLIPIYFKSRETAAASVAVMRCSFDGKVVKYHTLGNVLKLNVKRGLCEPSITFYQNRYYLTIRNDIKGYVTVSDDGLHFAPIKPWTFEDGTELGSYNTQQHWITHSDGLFLVYTRRGAGNDHIPRNRAPLFIGQVDPEKMCVIRKSERILIPENNATLGNFGASAINEKESWVTVGESVLSKSKREASVFSARILWSKPNRLLNIVAK